MTRENDLIYALTYRRYGGKGKTMNNTAKKITADIILFPKKGLTDRQLDNRLDKLAALDAEIKTLKEQADALKAEIIEGMNGEHHETSRYKINNTLVNSTRFDSTSLKKDMPDIYKLYAKPNNYNRFTYKAL